MESTLPATDRRSPFYVNVPPHDSKPITHLVAYFKLWKHFILALVAYLKDLTVATEFQLNLNLQLVGLVQFPGFRDLAYKAILSVELPATLPASTPSESLKQLEKRPGIYKTKLNSSFLKNQTFAHKRSDSGAQLGNVLSAKYAPKLDVAVDPGYFAQNLLFTLLPQTLVLHHFQIYQAQLKMLRELAAKVTPRLETLHRNLLAKIKEIKLLLKNDVFANNSVIREVSKTGSILNVFVSCVQRYSAEKPVLKHDFKENDDPDSLYDPFLIKLRLDYQLKKQLIQENFVFALYVNLQNIARDLLLYVVKDLHSTAERLSKLVKAVHAPMIEHGVVSLHNMLKTQLELPAAEWEHFITHNNSFINTYTLTPECPKRETRLFGDVVVPYAQLLHSKCLRLGAMYRKQKLVKTYSSHYYLLTPNYLHEFKIEGDDKKASRKKKGKIGGVVGHDDYPVQLFNLNDCAISIKSEKDYKFVLSRVAHPAHKFTFKCLSEADFHNWSRDLHDLLKFGSRHLERFAYIQEKLDAREQFDTGAGAPQPKKDLNLNLGSLLNQNLLLDKITDKLLTGIFTPRVQLPVESDKNPFESTFELIKPELPKAESAVSDHLTEHETYLKLQQELMRQQQKLLDISKQPVLRNSLTELMMLLLEQNGELHNMITQSKKLLESPEYARQKSPESMAVPTVNVEHHS